jgi:tetratricopeptide (TPR) repeat protein
MKSLLFCLLFLCAAHSVWPCINTSGTRYGGGTGSASFFGWKELQVSLMAHLQPTGNEMELDLRSSTNFTDRSDYAVALMYLGRSQEAVDLLNQLEKEKAGEYFVAGNLGTAYELSGNNEEALHWIREAIRRNPASHEGTEWLHEKILEAKIAQQNDPRFFEKHSVLELQPGKIDGSITVGPRTFPSKLLTDAIQHQLFERLKFVKPPDAAVASLLFDYAVIEAATKSMESAKHILSMATDYGYPSAKVKELSEDFDRRLARADAKRYGVYGLAGAAVIGVLVILFRRKIFVLSKRDLKPS